MNGWRALVGFMAAPALASSVQAYQGMPIRPLQVVGRHLKDDTGKIVMLHGWMQPSGWYWNGRAFPDPVEYTPEECAPERNNSMFLWMASWRPPPS
jgi:hypothetical protein